MIHVPKRNERKCFLASTIYQQSSLLRAAWSIYCSFEMPARARDSCAELPVLWEANGGSSLICISMSFSEHSLKKDSWLKHTHFLFMEFSNMVKWNCLGSFRGRTFTTVSWSSAKSILLLTDLPWLSQKSSSKSFYPEPIFSITVLSVRMLPEAPMCF